MGLYRARLTLDAVEQAFRRQHWHYEISGPLLSTTFNDVFMLIGVDEEQEILHIYAPLVPGQGMSGYSPVAPDLQRDLALYLMAVNYFLVLGTYGRDPRDGEFRYVVSLPVSGAFLSDEQLAQLIKSTVVTVSRRAPIVLALLTRKMSLSEALDDLTRQFGRSGGIAV